MIARRRDDAPRRKGSREPLTPEEGLALSALTSLTFIGSVVAAYQAVLWTPGSFGYEWRAWLSNVLLVAWAPMFVWLLADWRRRRARERAR